MPEQSTAERLVIVSRTAGATVWLLSLLIKSLNWITVHQFTVLLTIGISLGIWAPLMTWRMRKAARIAR